MLTSIVFSVIALVLPEPTYSGPDNVIYFREASGLDEELKRNLNTTWLVAFYTVWNPACVNFASTFAQLSTEYDLDNLKFGKIDIGRYPEAGQKHHVNDSSLSKQLPTVILFKNGKEYVRRPVADSKGKLIHFLFSSDNVRGAFDLKNLYAECKKQLKSSNKHIKNE